MINFTKMFRLWGFLFNGKSYKPAQILKKETEKMSKGLENVFYLSYLKNQIKNQNNY